MTSESEGLEVEVYYLGGEAAEGLCLGEGFEVEGGVWEEVGTG